jgi:hypothetical protein
MSDRPEPLVPAEVDLRDFKFMPLDVVRLRDSGLTAKATGDEFRAAVLLWCASWHQVPAASLPDDDDELANICGYSRSRREWAKVRVGALRNWTACSDGRLYHAAVAGKALEAWIEKLASAIGGAAGNAKRWNVKIDTDGLRVQFRQAVEALRTIDPQSNTLRKKAVAVLTMPSLPESHGESGGESGGDSHPDRKGQGQGQGQGQGEVEEKAPPPPAAVAAPPPRPERGTRLPAGWAPGPEQTAFAESLGIRNGVAAAELEKFRDYWAALPGQKGVKTDWTATWRNWLRRKAEDMGGKPAGSGGDIFAGAE